MTPHPLIRFPKANFIAKSLVLAGLAVLTLVPTGAGQTERALASSAPRAANEKAETTCGQERWPVKTLADDDAASVDPSVVTGLSVSDLVKFPGHSKKELLRMADSRYPEETKVYQVDAQIVGFKREADGDFHIVIADLRDPQKTMIVEIPDPVCKDLGQTQLRSDFEARFGHATAKYKTLAKPARVVVSGPGFYDFIHGQTGVAANGFELHPVLKMSWSTLSP